MWRQVRPAVIIFLLLTVLTGLVYPFFITGIAQVAFPYQANGSIIENQGKAVGSALIGQPFSDPKYFWGRPSSSSGYSYNPLGSTGSNFGPLNPSWISLVQERVQALHAADPGNNLPIPVDLVTASASGLDPHISLAAAEYQAARVARLRSLSMSLVEGLISKYTINRGLGFLGEPVVNVLELNLALDGIK